MIVGSLFSGVGGFDLGLERAGHTIAFQCEWDEWRRRVLAAHWPGVTCHPDVRDVGGSSSDTRRREDHGTGNGSEPHRLADGERREQLASVDLLCGGFPCQDLSVAGRRAGLAGSRSSLFFEFMRVADELVRPGGWCLVENVPGLLSSNGGRDMATVLRTLADLGFRDLAYRVLDSRFFGVAQRRRRVFILARRARGCRAREVLLEPESSSRDLAEGGEAGQGVATTSSLSAQNGRGYSINAEQAAGGQLVVNALDRMAGGADDNSAQANHLVTARCLTTSNQRIDGETETFVVADTLTSGSHPHSNMPGRRREDDTNIVEAFNWQGDTNQGASLGLTAEPNLTGSSTWAVPQAQGVRRLTPVECSRLQGFPDTWLELDYGYADAQEAHAAQILRRLWQAAGSETGEGWRPGVLASLLTPQILLAGVHGGWIPWPMAYRRAASGRQVQGENTWPEATLRRLWEYAQHRPSPYGREPFEQLARELGRSLPTVPPTETSAVAALLRSELWPEASAQWVLRPARPASETGRSSGRSGAAAPPPKPLSPDSRRYAAMGDAVTVPVAAWIGMRLARYGEETR